MHLQWRKVTAVGVLLVCLVAVVAVVVSVKVKHPPPPTPPTVIKQFYDPQFDCNLPSIPTPSQFWYDEVYQGWRYEFNHTIFGLPYWQAVIQPPSPALALIMNDVCRIVYSEQNFTSMFYWLPNATYRGQVEINNRTCDEWFLPFDGSELVYDGLSSNASIPVRFVFPYKTYYNEEKMNATLYFSDQLVPGPSPNPEEMFFIAPKCFTEGTLCDVPPNQQVIPFSAYIFHPDYDFGLANHNVADLYGDALFVCLAMDDEDFLDFSLITLWELSINSSYGQYGFCNFGECVGGNTVAVGREAYASFGVNGGQCGTYPNNITGSWFSLPEGGLCPEGQPVGTNGCTWQIGTRVKTISAECLRNHSFLDVCYAELDKGFPLTQTNEIFKQAFKSDNEKKNGCPSLPVSNVVASKSRQQSMSDIKAKLLKKVARHLSIKH